MVQILRATIVCKSGRVIIQRYAEIEKEVGKYLSPDLEKSRENIREFHEKRYGPVDHINLSYREVEE